MDMRLAGGVLLLTLCAQGCHAPGMPDQLREGSPTPTLGRPAWVRAAAGYGSAAGMTLGSVFSVALMPVTWPLARACSSHLSEAAESEFLWFPASSLSAVGHAAIGAPADFFDYALRRAWSDRTDPVEGDRHAPLADPAQPAWPVAQELIEDDG